LQGGCVRAMTGSAALWREFPTPHKIASAKWEALLARFIECRPARVSSTR
jgi:hypothetical protein